MSSPSALFWAARHPPADPKHLSFAGLTVLVTGANSGLGHQAAIKYASLGAARLILAVRSQEKGETATQEITRASGCGDGTEFVVETVDFASFASVAAFADRVKARVDKLHVVQLAAGVVHPGFEKGPEGFEFSLQVNVLSQALLALLLLPKLRETAAADPSSAPTMSFVNSVAHLEVKPEWIADGETLVRRLDDGTRWDQTSQYYLEKLAGMFVVRGVAERAAAGNDAAAPGSAGGTVVVNASCPGMCKTNMGRDFPLGARVFMSLFYVVFGRTAEAGSRSMVGASALGEESQGRFWTNDKYMAPSDYMKSGRGEQLFRETWAEILSILRKHVKSDLI